MKSPNIKAHLDVQNDPWIALLQQRIEQLRFGTVQIVVHEGKITQIECTEKIRLTEKAEGVRSSK